MKETFIFSVFQRSEYDAYIFKVVLDIALYESNNRMMDFAANILPNIRSEKYQDSQISEILQQYNIGSLVNDFRHDIVITCCWALYPTIKLKVWRHTNDELKYDNDILNGKLQLLDISFLSFFTFTHLKSLTTQFFIKT